MSRNRSVERVEETNTCSENITTSCKPLRYNSTMTLIRTLYFNITKVFIKFEFHSYQKELFRHKYTTFAFIPKSFQAKLIDRNRDERINSKIPAIWIRSA